MSPVGSDAFIPADFSQTFNILDANPGVRPVPNAASRPTDYTVAQHGSLVLQTDLDLVWKWHQPNSGTTGQWVRIGVKGYLDQFSNSGTVATSTTAYANGPTVTQGTITIPGGRPLLIMLAWTRLDNQYNRSVLSYWENNVRVVDLALRGSTSDLTTGNYWLYRNPAPVASTSVTFKLTLAAYAAAAPNGGGTSTIGGGGLAVFEL